MTQLFFPEKSTENLNRNRDKKYCVLENSIKNVRKERMGPMPLWASSGPLSDHPVAERQ